MKSGKTDKEVWDFMPTIYGKFSHTDDIVNSGAREDDPEIFAHH